MIVNHLIEIYILIWISVVIHELAHYCVAKIIKLNVAAIHIGDDFFAVHIGKLFISPMVFSGAYVEFYSDAMNEKTTIQKVIFFTSGPFANLLLVCVSFILRSYSIMYMDIFLWINIYFFLQNIFPFFIKGNDVAKMRRYIHTTRR